MLPMLTVTIPLQEAPVRRMRRLDAPDIRPGTGILEVVQTSETAVEFKKRNPDVDPPLVLPMVGVLYSDNCGFVMNITASALIVDRVMVEEKAMQYSMVVSGRQSTA